MFTQSIIVTKQWKSISISMFLYVIKNVTLFDVIFFDHQHHL